MRQDWGRLAALLLARFRRLDLVEDALADAVETAARTWPAEGVPDNPTGWLRTVAQRRILDRLRAEAMARTKHRLLATDLDRRGPPTTEPGSEVADDLLRLVLMCSHPALAPESASALSLRLVLGVSTHDIARLFLVSESTMAARITRAKKKIVGAGIPFSVPGPEVIGDRLAGVAQTAYLAFTAGYAPGSGAELLRVELAGEAVHLTRTVRDLRPEDPTTRALLALLLLQHSRRDARVGPDGSLVLLGVQDRRLWRADEIAEAKELLQPEHWRGQLPIQAASYLLQAWIAAEHAASDSAAATRWDRIVGHYDRLLQLDPSPGAALARAVAVAEADGPRAGLAALDGVDLAGSHRPDAVRAELLARAGESAGAARAFDRAISLCRNEVERSHLQRRRDAL